MYLGECVYLGENVYLIPVRVRPVCVRACVCACVCVCVCVCHGSVTRADQYRVDICMQPCILCYSVTLLPIRLCADLGAPSRHLVLLPLCLLLWVLESQFPFPDIVPPHFVLLRFLCSLISASLFRSHSTSCAHIPFVLLNYVNSRPLCVT